MQYTVYICDSVKKWMHPHPATWDAQYSLLITPFSLNLLVLQKTKVSWNQRTMDMTYPFWAIKKYLHPFPLRFGWFCFLSLHISPSKGPSSPQVVRTSAMAFLLTSMAYRSSTGTQQQSTVQELSSDPKKNWLYTKHEKHHHQLIDI